MTVLGVGIETAATMDSEPVIMVPGEPQTYTTQQKNQVDRFPISLMQSSLHTKGPSLDSDSSACLLCESSGHLLRNSRDGFNPSPEV